MDKYNFQKLTPINDVELNIYDHALDFIFKNLNEVAAIIKAQILRNGPD